MESCLEEVRAGEVPRVPYTALKLDIISAELGLSVLEILHRPA